MIKRLIKRTLSSLGLEVRRVQRASTPKIPRNSLSGMLQQVKKLGLQPATVIDVGAANGTPELYEEFPTAHHALLEPLEEFRKDLEAWKQRYAHMEYIIAAAGKANGEITLNVHPDLYGSSIYLEGEKSDVNGIPRTVPMVTIDSWCAAQPAPYLLKVDVQGAELDVLAGAEQILKQTAMVVLETSMFQFFIGGPQFYDVIHFMHERGFVLYDIGGTQYRLLDNALSQVDVVFIPNNSPLRQDHSYATPEQRRKQNEMFQEILGKKAP